MFGILLNTLLDVLKMLPILLVVYLLIELIQTKMSVDCLLSHKSGVFGPVIGAAVGCIPQCGFSAAATALYKNRMVTVGTLVAVFLATSDEAIPVLLSHPQKAGEVVWLIAAKLCIALVAGYAVDLLFGKRLNATEQHDHDHEHDHEHEHKHEHEHEHEHEHDHEAHYHDCHHPCACDGSAKSILVNTITHTLKISLFVLMTLLAVNLIVYWVGEANISKLLLEGSVFQPLLTALIGLIPGCATSVLLAELFVNGTLTFGSTIAGLCSGAGFGYILLFGGRQNKTAFKNNLIILLSVYVAAVLSGMLLNLWS